MFKISTTRQKNSKITDKNFGIHLIFILIENTVNKNVYISNSVIHDHKKYTEMHFHKKYI